METSFFPGVNATSQEWRDFAEVELACGCFRTGKQTKDSDIAEKPGHWSGFFSPLC
jgi:hypothetical protein